LIACAGSLRMKGSLFVFDQRARCLSVARSAQNFS
jgi:hypothetical protein